MKTSHESKPTYVPNSLPLEETPIKTNQTFISPHSPTLYTHHHSSSSSSSSSSLELNFLSPLKVADNSTTLRSSLHVSSSNGRSSPLVRTQSSSSFLQPFFNSIQSLSPPFNPCKPNKISKQKKKKKKKKRKNKQVHQLNCTNQMQELQPINGIVNGGVLLRRTPYVVQPPTQQQAPLQQTALKCPRCDSLNTKFCYYNNYNLSQPRHFCKNCRRYWTKGGVLRNVPVGGGCRKSKRTSSSKSKQPSTNGKKNGHNSAVDGGLVRIPEVDNAVEVNGDGNSNSNSNGVSCGGLFSDDIGGFINLISNDNNEVSISVNDGGEAGGGGGETTSFSEFLQNQEWEMGKIICGVQEEKRTMAVDDEIGDPTVGIEDFLPNRGSNNNNSSSNVGLSTLDWHLTADNHQGLFDNHTIDHHDYWSQSTSAVHHHHHHDPQWSDSTTNHFPLFLP